MALKVVYVVLPRKTKGKVIYFKFKIKVLGNKDEVERSHISLTMGERV